jgi:hypothetical protein
MKMKKVYIGFLSAGLVMLSLNLIHAQSIVVNSPNPTIVVGSADEFELETGIEIMNISLEQKDIKVRRTILTSIENTTNFFCWTACYTPVVSLSPNGLTVNGDSTTNNSFSSHFRPNLQVGVSEIQYTFFDANNPQDSANVVVRYEIAPVGISKISNVVSLKAYPNPADDKVTLSYTRSSLNSKSSIELYNMLGAKVFSQQVEDMDGTITISTENLKAGLYFYSINDGGQSSRPGRLTVKH